MTGTTETSDGLDLRRRRLLFRSWHRGTREMDLVLGRFADARLRRLPEGSLDAFEALIEAPDRELFAWITGTETIPAEFDTALLGEIRAFHAATETRV